MTVPESFGPVVVILTGYSEASGALSAVELGAHGYIRKGGSIPRLLAQIREVLEHRTRVADRFPRRASNAEVLTAGSVPVE